MNLIEFFRNLFLNPQEAAKFQADPEGYLQESGVTEASYDELVEAVTIVCSEPVSQGAQVATGGSAANQGGGYATAASPASSPVAPTGSGSAPAATPTTPPPPPPPPPADMPPADMVQDVVNHYVTEVYETNTTVNETTVYDNDTNVDNSVTNVVDAEEGAVVTITNDNDATTASGEGSSAFGEDADIDGFAQGANSVAAGDDIEAPVVTGTNEGIVNDDGSVDLENSPIGDNNTVVDDGFIGDSNTVVDDGIVGDNNVQSQDDGDAAGRDLNDTDVTIGDGANVEDSNFGVGNTSASDDDITINDNDGIDVDDNDGIDVDLLSDQDLIDVDLGRGAGGGRGLEPDFDVLDPVGAAKLESTEKTGDSSGDRAPEASVAEQATQIEEPPPVEDLSPQLVTEEADAMLDSGDDEMLDLD